MRRRKTTLAPAGSALMADAQGAIRAAFGALHRTRLSRGARHVAGFLRRFASTERRRSTRDSSTAVLVTRGLQWRAARGW